MRQLKITQKITNREDVSLEKYLQEVAKEDLISVEEESDLAKMIRAGDKNAVEKLAKANLRFVISVAKQYQNQGLSLVDLISEGNIGLMKAVQKFDETKGFKFISYAVWWIRQAIMQALAENSRIVKLPTNRIVLLNRINKVISSFEQDNERLPTEREISEILEVSVEWVVELKKFSSYHHTSIDAHINDDEDSQTLLDILPYEGASSNPNKELMLESLQEDIKRALSTISQREGDILRMYFGFDNYNREMTLEEIADKFGLTREGARQIKEKAIRRLRQGLRSKILAHHLGD